MNHTGHESTVQFRQPRPTFAARIRNFFVRHLQVLFYSLGQLSRTPLSTLMTAAALGIALALPAGLYVLLDHVKQLGSDVDSINQISLFMNKETTRQQAVDLQNRLSVYAEISNVKYVSSDAALAEFQHYSGFGDALEALEENPLPHLLIIYPNPEGTTPQQLTQLLHKLQQLEQVDIAQMDIQWLQRLYAMIHIGQRGVFIIGSLLALAALLIVGNTIRLAIENRRNEIVVMKLIGATNSFIRRPFLYTGLWYGLLGSLIALLLVNISLIMIKDPLTHLSTLYEHDLYSLGLMSISASARLVLSGCLLGLMGAWIAVSKHLREIEPK